MANYNSIPRRFNPSTSSINTGYIDQVIREKQKTVDTNVGLMAQSVEKVLNVDLAREGDKEILKDKLSTVLNSLESNDSINFASKRAQFSIQAGLSEAAKDPYILKQINNTRKIRQVQEFYKNRSDKGKINTNNFNYAYQKAGINNYLKGQDEQGNKVDEIGDFQYLEYRDVDKKLLDVATKLKASLPDDPITVTDKTGRTIEKKMSQVSPQEMQNHLRTQLDSEDLAQLEIDGSYMYGMSDKKAMESRLPVIESKKKEYQDIIDAHNKELTSNDTLTDGQREEKIAERDAVVLQKSEFEKEMLEKQTAGQIGGQQLLNNRLSFYSKLFTKDRVISEKYDKATLKAMRQANAVKSYNGQNPNISTVTSATQLPKGVKPLENARKEADIRRKAETQAYSTAISKLPSNKKQIFNSKKEELRNRKDVIKEFGENISDETLNKLALDEVGMSFLPADSRREVEDARNKVLIINKKENEATDEYITAGVMNKDTFNQVYKHETALTMSLPQGDVNIQQFLIGKGVKDWNSYKSFIESDTKEAKAFKSTIALQTLELKESGFIERNIDKDLEYRKKNPGVIDGIRPFVKRYTDIAESFSEQGYIKVDDKGYQIMRKASEDISGENLEDTYNIEKTDIGYKLTPKGSNTSFGDVVKRTESNRESGGLTLGTFASETIWSGFGLKDTDRTAENESKISKNFSQERYDEFYTKKLNEEFTTVAGDNLVRIKGAEKKEDLDLIRSEIDANTDKNNPFDSKLDVDVYKLPQGGYLVYQTQKYYTEVTDKDGKVSQEEKSRTVTATINPTQIPKMPNFSQYIETEDAKFTVESLADLRSSVKDIRFIGGDTNVSDDINEKQIEGLNRLLNRENQDENKFRLMASKTKSKEILFSRENEQYLNLNPQVAKSIKDEFDDFQKNTHNYSLSISKDINEGYNVNILNKEGKPIGNVPLVENVPVDIFKKVYYGAPSAFLSLYTHKRINEYKSRLQRNAR